MSSTRKLLTQISPNINEAWSVIIDTSYARPRITVTNKEKYFGYIKYISEWFFGGIKLFFSNLFSRNK